MTVRIGVNARTFTESQPGGAVQAAIRLTHALKELPSVELVLFAHKSIQADFQTVPVVDDYYYRPTQSFGVIWERTVLPWLAKQHNIDILFCPNGNAPLMTQPFPVVTCVHDLNSLRGFTSGIHSLYRKAAVPQAVRISDHLITVSSFSKSELIDQTTARPGDITVVHNGIDDVYHNCDTCSTVDVPDSYLLYVGSINPRKNLSRALKAFVQFSKETATEYRFVLVGPRNKTIFDRFDIPPNDDIISLGFLPRQKLKYVYENAVALLYPSLYEGFGLPPLEAMACGTPVVVSNTTSLPEIVGDAGEQVDPYDVNSIVNGIDAVLSDSRYRQELITRGRKRSQRFRWNHAAEQVADIVKQAIGQK